MVADFVEAPRPGMASFQSRLSGNATPWHHGIMSCVCLLKAVAWWALGCFLFSLHRGKSSVEGEGGAAEVIVNTRRAGSIMSIQFTHSRVLSASGWLPLFHSHGICLLDMLPCPKQATSPRKGADEYWTRSTHEISVFLSRSWRIDSSAHTWAFTHLIVSEVSSQLKVTHSKRYCAYVWIFLSSHPVLVIRPGLAAMEWDATPSCSTAVVVALALSAGPPSRRYTDMRAPINPPT